MTIDEAIAYCENQISFSNEEYRKLAEWLEELKIYKSDGFAKDLQKFAYQQGYSKAENDYLENTKIDRESSYEIGYEIGYNKAIDDFEKEMIRSSLTEREKEYIRYKAEQLKEGGTDE